MRRIMTKRKKDGSEYHYNVQLESSEKDENKKLITEGKNKKYSDEGSYKDSTTNIISYIDNKQREYVTNNKAGGYTKVVVKTGTKDDPKQKYITTVMNEGEKDNLLELEEYD